MYKILYNININKFNMINGNIVYNNKFNIMINKNYETI